MKRSERKSKIVYSIFMLLFSCILIFGFYGCRSKIDLEKKEDTPIAKHYFIGKVGDVTLLQVYAEPFKLLSFRQKMKAYHLYCAAIAGRDIAYDQNHRFALQIRNLMENIIYYGIATDSTVYTKILNYTQQIWINNGQYNQETLGKFTLSLTPEQLYQAAKDAENNGARFNLTSGETLKQHIYRLSPHIFNPDMEPWLVNRHPRKKDDLLLTSANNLYRRVKMDELKNFKEHYPLNSRLVKKNHKIIEEVYRTGNDSIAPGRYDDELRTICSELNSASEYAGPAWDATVKKLIGYFETGDEDLFHQYLFDTESPPDSVRFVGGFFPSGKDPRGEKGEFGALVYFTPPENSSLIKKYIYNYEKLAHILPWNTEKSIQRINPPDIEETSALIGTGNMGPVCPEIIYNLQSGDQETKTLFLQNIHESVQSYLTDLCLDEFAYSAEEKKEEKELGQIAERHLTLLREVFRGANVYSPDKKTDPFHMLEEALCDLTALWLLPDETLLNTGILQDKKIARVAYRCYIRKGLIGLGQTAEAKFPQNHPERARKMILNWLMANSNAVEIKKRRGKTYFVINDFEGMREGIANLATIINKIIETGDLTRGNELLKTYTSDIDPNLIREITKRREKVGIPERIALVFPELIPVYNAEGNIKDIDIVYPGDFRAQMLRFSHFFPEEKQIRENQ